MTEDQISKALLLERVRFGFNHRAARFAEAMIYKAKNDNDYELTEKQAYYLDFLCHRYRRQINA